MDVSKADYMIGVGMARKGFSPDQIGGAIEQASPELPTRKAGHEADYVARMVKAVFTHPEAVKYQQEQAKEAQQRSSRREGDRGPAMGMCPSEVHPRIPPKPRQHKTGGVVLCTVAIHEPIDQHQIGADVAVAVVLPVASQGGVSVLHCKLYIVREGRYDLLQIGVQHGAVWPFSLSLEIPLECGCRLNLPHEDRRTEHQPNQTAGGHRARPRRRLPAFRRWAGTGRAG